MPRRTPQRRPNPRVSVHATLPADVAARLRAFAGWHGCEISAVVAEALRTHLRGFAIRQDGAAIKTPSPGEGEGGQAA